MSDELIAGLGGALIGAILSGGFAWVFHKTEQVSLKKEELRRTIAALLELRAEWQSKVSKLQDPQDKEFAGSLLNTKKSVYLEAAENLVREIPAHVSSIEYAVLAEESIGLSNFGQAEEYYKRSVQASKSVFLKAFAARSLALFYFGQGPQRDFEKGRDYFKLAIDLVKNPQDDYSLYTQGFTYQAWGLAELWNGFHHEGLQKVDRAKKYYNDISVNNPLRAQSLEWLNAKVALALGNQAPTADQLAGAGSQLLPASIIQRKAE